MVNEDCPFKYGAKVVSLQGQLSYSPNGINNWRPARIQQTICQSHWVRVDPNSRASLRLSTGVVLRVDQGSVLVLDDITPNRLILLRLISGFVHFISRTPIPLKITTPIANAGPEGTEFAVRSGPDRTSVWVYEGKVKFFNAKGSLDLKPGQGAQARLGQAPQAKIDIQPEDAVHWALYYPPLLPYTGQGNVDSSIANAINNYRHGHIDQALSQLDAMPQNEQTPYFYKVRAAIRLSAGQDQKALDDIHALLRINPNDAVALALKSVIALTQNRKDEAYSLANQAVAANPKSATAYSALSYAEQGRFQLDKAQKAAAKAAQLAPNDAMVWARKAELELAQGLTGDSRASAGQALKLDSGLERTQTVTGFTQLLRIDADDALESFNKAIELDSTSPLARLGLGLAKIRNGDLAVGREDIEIAAILDPNNSLIRSYLGKAYYEERRNPLAEDQFKLAKERDPKDPTPYFYDAIEKQTTNRPVAALYDMEKAIELNNNRAVYRSNLHLDEDAATRTANLARIYNDLGFNRLALKNAWDSLGLDIDNYSSHRYLTDAYMGQPRFRTARASELLQAQLLQPINIVPVQPQLTNENIGILNNTGPASLSTNEYDRLFTANGAHLLLNGAIGSRNTKTDNAVISAIYNNFSTSLGQFHYQTDGFRENDQYKQDIYDLFTQYAVSPDLNLQLELKMENLASGDTPLRLNGFHRKNFSKSVNQDTARFGLHYKFNHENDFLLSSFYTSFRDWEFNQTEPRFPSVGPDEPPVGKQFDQSSSRESQGGTQTELQHIYHVERLQLLSGFGYLNLEGHKLSRNKKYTQDIFGDYIFCPMTICPETKLPRIPNHVFKEYLNGYLYLNTDLIPQLNATLGLSIDNYKDEILNLTKINPKFGLSWRPSEKLTLRGAAFKTLKRPLAASQTIEPTQIAGFNQFFDSENGSTAWHKGLGFDYKLRNNIFLGGQITFREIDFPIVTGKNAATLHKNESSHLAYFYWVPRDYLSIAVEYRFDHFRRAHFEGVGVLTDPKSVTTHQVPISLNFYHPTGLFTKLAATYVNQQVTTVEDSPKPPSNNSKDFWTFDASIGYRFPQKFGSISFEARNIFDKAFRYESVFDASGPQLTNVIPERQLFVKLNLNY